MEKVAYIILIILAIGWLITVVVGTITSFPFGIIGLVAIFAFGLLFVKVLKERLASSKDDHYSKDVER